MDNRFFGEIKGNLGFGCMRLPMKDGEIDEKAFSIMVDAFIDNGFNYFDTAHGYHDGKSEPALRKCLTARYARDEYLLIDKLTEDYFKTEADIQPFFESQLEICGVDYFDFYLMHSQTADIYEHFKKCHAYETAYGFKKEGRIRHFGLSFHDKAEVLDRILTEHPEVEFVQIQFNYVDYDDPGIESRACYEVCRRHCKPVIVMEPVKGGSLAVLPDAAHEILSGLGGGSDASYAVRYAASFEGVMMVLSGMSNMEQLEDNMSFMKDFKPLTDSEFKAIADVREIVRSQDMIPCTACRYCTKGCPKQIDIPNLFSCMNAKKQYHDWNSDWYYMVHTQEGGKASDCIKCGKCEHTCPQHLEIRKLLEEVAEVFEQKPDREE